MRSLINNRRYRVMDTEYREPGDYPYGNPAEPRWGNLKRVSWGAIFAGGVVTISVELALGILGIGVGLGLVRPTEQDPLGGFGIGAGIWFGISTIIALFLGGLIAGRLAGIPRDRNDGMIHGIIVWGLATLASFYLMTTAMGSILSGVSGVIGKGLSMIGSGIQAAGPKVAETAQQKLQEKGISLDTIMDGAKKTLRQTGKPELQPEQLKKQASEAAKTTGQEPQSSDTELSEALKKLFANPKQAGSAADKDAVVNILVARTGMSREQATTTVDNWIQQYYQASQKAEEAKQQALQKSEQVMKTLSKAAIWDFIAMLIGVVVAALGGKIGSPREVFYT
jgi:polyhydroxyalkanoate synthesis regulator phasin